MTGIIAKKKVALKLSGKKTKVLVGDQINIRDIVFEDEDSSDRYKIDPNSLPEPKSAGEAESFSRQWFNRANSETDKGRKSAYLAVSKKYLSIASTMQSKRTLGDKRE